MSELHLTVEGYVREVGDLGLVKLRTRTRSEAQVLSGHSAVIWLDGVRGCYLLDRVRAIPETAGEQPK